MDTATATLTIEPLNTNNLSAEMVAAKSANPLIEWWAGGMCWKWEGGESQTIVVHRTCWHLIRFRGTVRTVQYSGIRQALEVEFGIKVVTN